MRAQDEETHHFGVELFQDVAHGEEVAQRLGHLLLVDAHKAVVHPVLGERRAVRALGLRDLVFVVRELQILAAAVNIEALAEEAAAHSRALDVPSGAPWPPSRRPVRLLWLGAFPKHEIEWIFLAVIDVDALAGAQLVERLA